MPGTLLPSFLCEALSDVHADARGRDTGMTTLLDRWQFGITTVYHFLFVPLTIGLALLVAIMQTLSYRRQDAEWDQLSRFQTS